MVTQAKSELRQIPVEQLSRGRFQPRINFDQKALEELAQSIKEQGIIEPIIVRPKSDEGYEIIAGERRWRAAQLAGDDTVSCIVRFYTDEEAAEVSIIENVQREDLNPIEEAMAYQRLMENFQYIHDEIASAVGKSRTNVTNALRLLNLDTRVQELLINKKLSAGHGKILAGLNSEKQFPLAEKCIKEAWSVRKLEQLVKKRQTQSAIQSSQDANVVRLEKMISERFGSDAKLDADDASRSGWLRIKYYDYETLAGILDKMGVEYDA